MSDSRPDSGVANVPLAVLAAVGGGLGGLTFFTLVGGAVTVARFRGAGLSGTKAVALVPRSDLLALGAQVMLLPTLVAALVVVPFVVVAPRRSLRRAFLGGLVVSGLIAGLAFAEAVWLVLALAVSGAIVAARGLRLDPPAALAWVAAIAVPLFVLLVLMPMWQTGRIEALGALLLTAITGAVAVDHLAGRSEFAYKEQPSVREHAADVMSPWRKKEESAQTETAQVRQGSRAPAAVMLFLIAALFVAIESYSVGYARPIAHAMAVLRADGRSGLCGIYVGESATQIWLGRVVRYRDDLNHGAKSQGAVIELPRSETSDVAIGASRSLNDAVTQGPELLDMLLKQRAAVDGKEPPAASEGACQPIFIPR